MLNVPYRSVPRRNSDGKATGLRTGSALRARSRALLQNVGWTESSGDAARQRRRERTGRDRTDGSGAQARFPLVAANGCSGGFVARAFPEPMQPRTYVGAGGPAFPAWLPGAGAAAAPSKPVIRPGVDRAAMGGWVGNRTPPVAEAAGGVPKMRESGLYQSPR